MKSMRNIIDLLESLDRVTVAVKRISQSLAAEGVKCEGTQYYGDDAFVTRYALPGPEWAKFTGTSHANFSVDFVIDGEEFSATLESEFANTKRIGVSKKPLSEMVPIMEELIGNFLHMVKNSGGSYSKGLN